MHVWMCILSMPKLRLRERRPVAHAKYRSKRGVQRRPWVVICSKVAVSYGQMPGPYPDSSSGHFNRKWKSFCFFQHQCGSLALSITSCSCMLGSMLLIN